MIILGNVFLFLHKNISCGYSLEDASNEYPQHMFLCAEAPLMSTTTYVFMEN